MKTRIERTVKPGLRDSEGEKYRKKAEKYLGLKIKKVKTIDVLTFDMPSLDEDMLNEAREKVFTNPVTQVSSFEPLEGQFDWDFAIWVGPKPGLMDPPGKTAEEAIEQYFGTELGDDEKVFTSKLYLYRAEIKKDEAEKVAEELHANPTVNQYKVFSREEWNPEEGIGIPLPEMEIEEEPRVETFPVDSEEELLELSRERGLELNPKDVSVIIDYFSRPEVIEERKEHGLEEPTDVELEYIAQARSDHCNHNTFNGKYYYRDTSTGEEFVVDNLFKETIVKPTKKLKEKKDWVKSVLWDNAGVGSFDEDWNYTISAETHNSPSNMDPYGGAITGNVGEFRDKMGTGIGSKVFMGMYGYCVGPYDYSGELKPHIHPRRLLDGVVEGVRDGGNKMGIPTPFGNVLFDESYLGKCLVYVGSVGIMPSVVNGKESWKKGIQDGDLCIVVGGRVGKDGIHGVTAASAEYSEETPVSHVQHGYPYLEKKVEGLLLEARNRGLLNFVWDLGGGGNSSAIGETAEFTGEKGGVDVELSNDLLKYRPMQPWEIWVSESQERMLMVAPPEKEKEFMELARKWDVEARIMGRYKDTGKIHVEYEGETVLHMDMGFTDEGFPQWEFEAEWTPPEARLSEPSLVEPVDHESVLLQMLDRPNVCSKEWVSRQYDHEVQGGSVVKPLVGKGEVRSEAVVSKPVLDSERGFAITQVLNPWFSVIDTYNMTSYVIDEAVRNIIAVGGMLDHIGGIDNYCWPSIQYDPEDNPDGKYKAAQLVRSCLALKDTCEDYGIPLLSGKDSMYIDGRLEREGGGREKISGKPTLQFTANSIVEDVEKCVTLDAKSEGDLVYVIGETKDELGASEYYSMLGHTGLNVPEIDPQKFYKIYEDVEKAIDKGLLASAYAITRGGLGVALSKVSIGGMLGMEVDLSEVPGGLERDDRILYSESAGRFLVTVAPGNREEFEELMSGHPMKMVGKVGGESLKVNGVGGEKIIDVHVKKLEEKYKERFGDKI